eukprot:6171961-Pleurochrysis_carterae.AAC.3
MFLAHTEGIVSRLTTTDDYRTQLLEAGHTTLSQHQPPRASNFDSAHVKPFAAARLCSDFLLSNAHLDVNGLGDLLHQGTASSIDTEEIYSREDSAFRKHAFITVRLRLECSHSTQRRSLYHSALKP